MRSGVERSCRIVTGAGPSIYSVAMALRPNPPRMVTVVIAIALLAVGLAGTVVPEAAVRDFVTGLSLPGAMERDALRLVLDRQVAYAALFASPMLLVVGSLLPGI
jgi:hypothetical protein